MSSDKSYATLHHTFRKRLANFRKSKNSKEIPEIEILLYSTEMTIGSVSTVEDLNY
jgi:hypothetical protein